MLKPYIFAHRGAMGYCIENTMVSFQKAVEMKVGLETDIQLTKDNQLICFHDPGFKIGNKWYVIKDLTLKELKQIKLEDSREIPTLDEVFDAFSYCPKAFRYSCDIGSEKVGIILIDLLEKYINFDQVEITDIYLRLLIKLRKYNDNVKLVHTIPYQVKNINKYHTINIEKLIQNNIKVLNIKSERINEKNFKSIIDYGFKCYVWGVNTKNRMKKVLKLRSNGEFVSAIYTNYPDVLKKFRDKIYP